jgi:ubiquinone/menaquinone biosynthesis C-methylase UbiE
MFWGSEPRVFEDYFRIFKSKGARRILILGCGYGRSILCFANAGLEITGLDFSRKALKAGKDLIRNCQFVQCVMARACNMPFKRNSFDGIFAYNIFHLLLDDERSSLVREIGRLIEKEGIVVVVALSIYDSYYGKGTEIEKNTFYVKRSGKTTHFFTDNEILEYFIEYQIMELSKIEIREKHGDRPHSHHALRVVAKKTNQCDQNVNRRNPGRFGI